LIPEHLGYLVRAGGRRPLDLECPEVPLHSHIHKWWSFYRLQAAVSIAETRASAHRAAGTSSIRSGLILRASGTHWANRPTGCVKYRGLFLGRQRPLQGLALRRIPFAREKVLDVDIAARA